MEAVKTRVNIPNDRHLVFDLRIPESVPAGAVDVVLIFQGAKTVTPQLSRASGNTNPGHPNQDRLTENYEKSPDSIRLHKQAELNANIQQMIAESKIQWSGGKPAGMPARVLSMGKRVSDAVIEDRR